MSPDQWERVIQVFGDALRSSPADPASDARDACLDDREVLAQVLLLLDSEQAMAKTSCEAPVRGPQVTKTCFPWLARPNLVGKMIAGQYEVIELIAVGGMGEVYKARQVRLNRDVALKILRPGFDLARFKKESEILASLRHTGIAHVIDADDHTDEHGTISFFTMEHIAGAEPITVYAGGANLDIHDRLELFASTCDAVQAAHQKNIIHRDLKPENILVDTDGRSKVIDFGVAWAADTVDAAHGGQPGTPAYMSPEQWDGASEGLDVRSDVYSLGVVLYELLCDRLPYDVRTCCPRTAEFDPPGAVNPELAGDVDNIVRMALQKQRSQRYRNAGELGDDIMRYLDGDRPEATRLAARSRKRRKPSRVAPHVAVTVLVAIGVIAVIAGILIPDWNGPVTNTPLANALLVNVPLANVEVTAKLLRGNVEIDFDETLEEDDKVWLTLEASRAGTFYVFRLTPGSVQRYECGPDDCEPIPYDPMENKRETPECRLPQGQEPRGRYCIVAVLLEAENPDICATFDTLAVMGVPDEQRIREAVLDIVGRRPDFIGCDTFSYETR